MITRAATALPAALSFAAPATAADFQLPAAGPLVAQRVVAPAKPAAAAARVHVFRDFRQQIVFDTEIVVRRDERRLDLYRGRRRVLTTVVGMGKPGAETPLGDRPGGRIVGIHGTSMPWLLGRAVSHGCVRVRNDVALRLRQLVPLVGAIRIVR